MKKTLLIIVSVLVAAFLFAWINDAWQATVYIKENGKAGTIRIGRQYNSSRWAEPLPLKKIHVYTATMAPANDVVVTSDQELVAGKEYFIRFLNRDQALGVREYTLRPIANSIRLRRPTDGTPAIVESTAAMDRLVDKAMGNKTVSAAPVHVDTDELESEPFLIGGAQDKTLELIWNNSATGEWLFGLFLLLLTKALIASAWFTPWKERRVEVSEEKDFVHPSLRRIDADVFPAPRRHAPIAFKPAPSVIDPNDAEGAREAGDPPLKLPRK